MSENNVAEYGWNSLHELNSASYITPRILSLLKSLAVHRILDIGSGNGAMCSQMQSLGYKVVGVEIDEKGVEISRKAHPSIPFYQYGVQNDPIELLKKEACFDAVVSTEVIEHLYSPHLLPQYASKVLRQDGYLILSTPYHGYLKNLAISMCDRWDDHHTSLWHGGHIKFWSRKTLSELLNENGFRVIHFSGVGRMTFLWKSMVLVAQKVSAI